MDVRMLRIGAVTLGAACLAVALALAVVTGEPEPEKAGPPLAAPLAPAPPPPVALPQVTDAQPPARQRPSFLVRFEAGHPLGRAQTLAAQGRLAEAEETARNLVAARRDMRGLCFDRFTAGGAELVLSACADLDTDEAARFNEIWRERFAAMAGVAYAEPNAVADVEQR